MIRLVRFQEPDEGMFAFYNTVDGNFLKFGGAQGFDDFKEVEYSYTHLLCDDSRYIDIERLRSLLGARDKGLRNDLQENE